jgi:hypothetical protein
MRADFARGRLSFPFVVVMLVIWVGGFVFGLYTWLVNTAGMETITLSHQALSVRHGVGPRGRTWEYDLALVRDLRFAPWLADAWNRRSGRNIGGFGVGAIAFDYGARTYRCGGPVEDDEARDLVSRLQAKLAIVHPLVV